MVMSRSEVNMGIFCCAGVMSTLSREYRASEASTHIPVDCVIVRGHQRTAHPSQEWVCERLLTPSLSPPARCSILPLTQPESAACGASGTAVFFFFVSAAGWVVREEEEEAQNKWCYESFIIQRVTAVFEYIWLPRSLYQCFLMITWSQREAKTEH